MRKLKLLILYTLALLVSAPALADEFLPPEQAFRPRVELGAGGELAVRWEISEGYKLYRESMSATSTSPAVALPPLSLPEGKKLYDEALGKDVVTFKHEVVGRSRVPADAGRFVLEVAYQGCAIGGFCYPPQTRTYDIDPSVIGAQAEVEVAAVVDMSAESDRQPAAQGSPAMQATSESDSAPASASVASDDAFSVERVLRGGSLLTIAGSFLLFGLLLSFTPCVLPMIPILSSIIVGQQSSGRSRGFLLAVSYSLGMALVYTALGVAAGLLGEGLAAFMQQPWVLVLFALMLTGFALSMFDVYQLQLPASWQGSVSEMSGRFQGGKYLGVFAMGAVSSLIVGPCVAGPLAGALLYISQTGNVATGGFALFAMACGMSVPLLLTGLSAGSLLPRAGAWMNGVKTVFGLLLLAVALWMINPLLGDSARLLAWGALLVLAAFFTPLVSPRKDGEGFFPRLGRVVGVLMLLTGLAEFWGGLMGNDNVFAPLRAQQVVASSSPNAAAHVSFERISGTAALEAALRDSTQPVVLDFYADWCTSCLEFEKFTFTDPRVVARMQGLRRLQIDVTRNTPDDRALMKRFRLFGPPAMVFFDPTGREIEQLRLIGYKPAAEFLEHIEKVLSRKGA